MKEKEPASSFLTGRKTYCIVDLQLEMLNMFLQFMYPVRNSGHSFLNLVVVPLKIGRF